MSNTMENYSGIIGQYSYSEVLFRKTDIPLTGIQRLDCLKKAKIKLPGMDLVDILLREYRYKLDQIFQKNLAISIEFLGTIIVDKDNERYSPVIVKRKNMYDIDFLNLRFHRLSNVLIVTLKD